MVEGSPDETTREREWVDPPDEFVAQANVTAADRDAFREAGWPDCWRRAADLLEWDRDFDAVLAGGANAGRDGGDPDTAADDGDDAEGAQEPTRWFPGGRLNAAHNCVDRHVAAGRGDETAVAWEGKLGETRTYTYRELRDEVNAFAAALRELGVGEGDVVTLYLPMIPELPVAMLACARIGAPHSVVFAGFSADALATRLSGANSEFLVTCDGYYRRGAALDLKRRADNACVSVDHSVEQVVVDRLDDGRPAGDDHAYADLVADHADATVDPVSRESDDLLFLIYTSGTTGEPTLVRHTTGGYLTHVAWTSHAVLDLGPEDTHWCSADVGWITGHSYAVYGPLALGATTVLYEGTPDHPETDRLWEIIERNDVDVFYTAPTSIRAFMKWGEEHPASHDLSSLRLLGSVGEPIDETAWHWYRDHVGDGDAPVVDTWWQTETGGIVLSTLPGVDRMRPGAVGKSLPGDRRLSTAEIESAIVGVEGVAEAAVVVGADDEAAHRSEIHAFVSPASNVASDEALRERVGEAVEEAIGSIAAPDAVTFAPSLPKTRSGKVVRRYLAAIANGEELGDTSALRNPEVVGELESLLER